MITEFSPVTYFDISNPNMNRSCGKCGVKISLTTFYSFKHTKISKDISAFKLNNSDFFMSFFTITTKQLNRYFD